MPTIPYTTGERTRLDRRLDSLAQMCAELYASIIALALRVTALEASGGAPNVAPVAGFSSSVSGLVATFTDVSTDSDGTIASRAWTFGDGATSTATNPSHTYASAGAYTVGLTVTDNLGATNNVTHDVTVAAAAAVVQNGLIVMIGDSIMNGYGDYGGADSGLAIDTSYSPVKYVAKSASGVASTMSWTDTAYGDLRPRGASGAPNMGPELSLGRYMVQYGGDSPAIAKFAINGATLGGTSGYLPTGTTVPTVSLYSQLSSFITAAVASSGKQVSAIVMSLGTNDASDSTNANAFDTNLTALATQLRADFGNNIVFILRRMNSANTPTGFPHISTVQAKGASWVAGRTDAAYVNIDHVPPNPADQIHPDANGHISEGNALARALADKLRPAHNDNQAATIAPWIQALHEPGSFKPGAPNPRAPDAKDGDLQILVVTANLLDFAIPDLITANGFVQLTTSVTTTNSGIYVSLRVWSRAVTAEALAAAGGRLPDAVLDDNNAENLARYITLRGPAALTAANIEVTTTSAPNSNSLTMSLAGGTTLGPNRKLIAIGVGLGGGAIGAAGTPTCAGATGVATSQNSLWTGSNKALMYIGEANVAAAGTYGPFAATITGSYAVWCGVMLAVKP